MDKKIINFDDTENEKWKFHQDKRPVLINDIDINKIVVFNKLPFGKRDFKFMCIFCPRMSIYKRDFDKTKCIYFLTIYKS